ncbi:SH3 domain-containing protein [Nonomuraea sp. K274]|uniref:SH3 domain-containing protein n=1 Tax=Nonomuraea cypriaca TaxID=1187855 RepID=A0A931AGB5_9ACTN|nr:SH3 domain-containing protein [Nonomuraea cypriaca]MBF8191443.1 SH3 domain-containing protein [Nonomuraea cypriaca]
MPDSHNASRPVESADTRNKKRDSAVIAAWIGASATIVAAALGAWVSATSEDPDSSPDRPVVSPFGTSVVTPPAGGFIEGTVKTYMSHSEWVTSNIRLLPDVQSADIGNLRHGDKLEIACLVVHGKSHREPSGGYTTQWYKVRTASDAYGYVSGHYVDVGGVAVPECDT